MSINASEDGSIWLGIVKKTWRVIRLPIVEGRYEAKISTKFKDVKDGIEEIKKGIKKSRKIRINGIPVNLLDKLRPLWNRRENPAFPSRDSAAGMLLMEFKWKPIFSKRWGHKTRQH